MGGLVAIPSAWRRRAIPRVAAATPTGVAYGEAPVTRLLRLFVLTLVVLAVAIAARPQAPAPDRPVTVHVNAIVMDRLGHPVPHLKSSDFALEIDGVARKIDAVAPHATADTADPQLGHRHSNRAALPAGARAFALLLDEFHVPPGAATDRVRDALTRFVDERLAPGDVVAVLKPLDSLRSIQFTRDRDATRQAIASFSGRAGDYTPRSAFERDFLGTAPAAVEAARLQIVLSALRTLATEVGELRPASGAVVLVSGGFADPDRTALIDPRLPNVRSVVRSAMRVDVPIYAFDPSTGGALQPAVAASPAPPDPPAAVLQRLATETGGDLVTGGGDLRAGLARMAQNLGAGYVIAFESPHGRDGQYHAISLRVKRRDARVLARAGFWMSTPVASRPAPGLPSFASTRMLHRSALIDAWLGVTRSQDGGARLVLTWAPADRDTTRALERPSMVVVHATTLDGHVVFDGQVSPLPDTGEPPSAVDRAVFEAPAGRLQIDMKIFGADGAVLDVDARDLDVPDVTASKRILVTPEILRSQSAREFRTLVQSADAAPSPGRTFSRTERLLVRVPAYDPAGGTPRITVTLQNRWGQPMRTCAALAPAPGTGIAQFDVPLAPLAPGDYIIQVLATGSSGTTKEAINIHVTG